MYRTRLAVAVAVIALGVGRTAAQNPNVVPSVLPASAEIPVEPITPAFPPPLIVNDSSSMRDLTPAGLFAEAPVTQVSHDHEARLPHDTPHGWFATGEYLLWRPRMTGLDYGIADPSYDLTPQGQVRNLSYQLSSGLRVGLGYRLPREGWEVGFTYTYLHSTANASLVAAPGGVLYPTQTKPGFIDVANRADASSSLDYNVFDVEFGRTWEVDPYLSLRAIGGVRFASIDANSSFRYDGLQAKLAEVRGQSGFDGVGPMAGLEARWAVVNGLSLFGNARGGLLYGDFIGSTLETNANGLSVNGDISDTSAGVAPFVSVALGGSWRWKNVSLAAGYEVTQWFNVMNRPQFTDDFSEGKVARRRSDLSFDGVFFRLGIGF